MISKDARLTRSQCSLNLAKREKKESDINLYIYAYMYMYIYVSVYSRMCQYTNEGAFMHIAGKVKIAVSRLSVNMGTVKAFEILLPWPFFSP